jgi:hypothetical protein
MTKILVKTATHDLQILRFESSHLRDLSVPLCSMSLRSSALRRSFDQERAAEEHRITLLTSLRVGGRRLHADTQPPGASPAPLPRRLKKRKEPLRALDL